MDSANLQLRSMCMCNGPHNSSTNGACVCTVGRVMGAEPHQLPEGPAAVQDVGFLDLKVAVASFLFQWFSSS